MSDNVDGLNAQVRDLINFQRNMRGVLEGQMTINGRLFERISALEIEVELLRKTVCVSP